MADSGWAPAKPSTGWPSLNSTTVGRLRIPKRATMSCSMSQSTLASSNSPRYSSVIFASSGISALHGAHHSAQKSTSTGLWKEFSITSCSKLAVPEMSKMYGESLMVGLCNSEVTNVLLNAGVLSAIQGLGRLLCLDYIWTMSDIADDLTG